MLLRNYDNIQILFNYAKPMGYPQCTDKDVFGDGHLNIKSTGGSIVTRYNGGNQYNQNLFGSFYLGENELASNTANYELQSNLIIGGGDTPVTYDDYCLTSMFSKTQVTANLQQHENLYYDDINRIWVSTYKKLFLANEDITVKEVGVTTRVRTAKSYDYDYLIYRDVLETPIEVKAGELVAITFTTKMGYGNKPTDYVATASVE